MVAPYITANKAQERRNAMRMVCPPQLQPPAPVNGVYEDVPIPQCIQMIPGMPYAVEIDTFPGEYHTIAAFHTFHSMRFDEDLWDIHADVVLVAQGIWGAKRADGSVKFQPIVEHQLIPNERSPTTKPSNVDGASGSYNLASNTMDIATGVHNPARQVDDEVFRVVDTVILAALSRLKKAITKKSVSNWEFETLMKNAYDDNVFGFGSLDPTNATNCQLNLSSAKDILVKVLGHSGSLHPDPGDCPLRGTFFLLLLGSLPPGKFNYSSFCPG
jgi:hypothetical protein